MPKPYLLFVSLLLLTGLVLGGCQKPVTPYGTTEERLPEGHNLEYPEVKPVETDVGPRVESLDSTGSGVLQGFASEDDPGSDAYKRVHGRTSPGMMPIYFGFDSASIEGEQVTRLEQNAQYLLANPATRIVIEGNCDERGTSEYNLALGERRAQNAMNFLVNLGIDPNRIRTVSYGEERPLFLGQDEESWSLNRRDDFVLE